MEFSTNTKYCFLCGIYPDDTTNLQQDVRTSLDYAADSYQKKIITGLKQLVGRNLTIISSPFIGAWPHNNKRLFSNVECVDNGVEYINGINCVSIRDYDRKHKIIKSITKWFYKEKGKKVLFAYSSNFSYVAAEIKKRLPELTVCLFLPDLPKYTYMDSSNFVRIIMKEHKQKQLEENCLDIDYVICITEQMKRYLHSKTGVECYVMEGFADTSRCRMALASPKACNEKKIISYTGTLSLKYGIKALLEAFTAIPDQNIELRICGGGNAVEIVEKAAATDKRIKYLGVMPPQEAKKTQMESDILVNPRLNKEEYTAYSFPSKVLEYLETGNPVVCYKLDGIPQEYDQFLFYPKDETTIGLSQELHNCLSFSSLELSNYRNKLLDYLLKNKSIYSQIKKLLAFVNRIDTKQLENDECTFH